MRAVFHRHPLEIMQTQNACVFACVCIVSLDKHTYPACWVISWQAHSQKKQTRRCIGLCMCLLLLMNSSDLSLRLEPQEANTGQRSLFGLSAFALKPLLLLSISRSWFITMPVLVYVQPGPFSPEQRAQQVP